MAILNYSPPTEPYLDILFRDEHLIVLNKPSGLLSVPGRALEHRDCLQNRVQTVFPTATVVHRLDMATSGIMVMTLHKDAHRKMSKLFELRLISKRYLARVFGKIGSSEGAVDLPLICDWPNRPKQMVDHERGKQALTHYKVLQSDDSETLVELTPVTGRSHQLRVHMLSLGHPILGDRLYAHKCALGAANRLQLHAQKLAFNHPISLEPVDFQCSTPFSFKSGGL